MPQISLKRESQREDRVATMVHESEEPDEKSLLGSIFNSRQAFPALLFSAPGHRDFEFQNNCYVTVPGNSVSV